MAQLEETTIQVSRQTLLLLKAMKEQEHARSYDELIQKRVLKKPIPRSMFGSNTKLRPFKHEERAEFHEF